MQVDARPEHVEGGEVLPPEAAQGVLVLHEIRDPLEECPCVFGNEACAGLAGGRERAFACPREGGRLRLLSGAEVEPFEPVRSDSGEFDSDQIVEKRRPLIDKQEASGDQIPERALGGIFISVLERYGGSGGLSERGLNLPGDSAAGG